MTIKVSIRGLTRTRRILGIVNAKIKVDVSDAMPKVGLFMQGKVKESIFRGTNAPVTVDTGTFGRSVDFQPSFSSVAIFSKIPYAKFLEFGTSRISPRPHFRNTKNAEKRNIRNIIARNIK